MQKPEAQILINRIKLLQQGVPEVGATAIISVDGLIIASVLPEGISEDRISAMSAAMLSLGERINQEMGLGKLEQLYTRSDNGNVVLLAIGKTAVLTTLVAPGAKLGVVFLELRRAADDIALLLDGKAKPS